MIKKISTSFSLMGMWEEYCGICGGPLSLDSETAKKEHLQWLANARVEGVEGIVHYDSYGRFEQDGTLLAEIDEYASRDLLRVPFAVHNRCYQLNGCIIPKDMICTELTAYHDQFFDHDQLATDGEGWKVYDPSISVRNKYRILSLLHKELKMTVAELHELCKIKGICKYVGLNKDQLIEKIREC